MRIVVNEVYLGLTLNQQIRDAWPRCVITYVPGKQMKSPRQTHSSQITLFSPHWASVSLPFKLILTPAAAENCCLTSIRHVDHSCSSIPESVTPRCQRARNRERRHQECVAFRGKIRSGLIISVRNCPEFHIKSRCHQKKKKKPHSVDAS